MMSKPCMVVEDGRKGAPAAAWRSWAEALPRVEAARLRESGEREDLGRRLRQLPAEHLENLRQAISRWWPPEAKQIKGVQLMVVHPDGRRQRVSFRGRLIRIGRDASCQLRLDSEPVRSHHCELRVEGDKLWLVDLAGGDAGRVNGHRLKPFEPWPLVSGDQVEIPPYRVVVGQHQVETVEPKAELALKDPLWLGAPPFDTEEETGAWVRLRCGEWEGCMRVPVGWLTYAYRALGYEVPAPSADGFGNEVDRAITSFLVQQIAADFAQRSGLAVSASGLLTGKELSGLHKASQRGWEGVRVDLKLGDQSFELETFWPVVETASSPAEPGPWLLDLPFSVAVMAGCAALGARELQQVEPGDILLPDHWFLQQGGEQAGLQAGSVLIIVQSWAASGRLRPHDGATAVEMTSGWRIAPKGGLMLPQEPDLTHERPEAGNEGAGTVRLPQELEVLVTFELERLSIPLRELASWNEGQIVELQRTPDEPVRIVLRQATGERLLGQGRVVVLEGKLGVQIDQWLVEEEG